MSDLLSKALLCGLGLASLTKDAIQKAVEDLIRRSKISEEEGRKLVKDLQRRSTLAQKALEKQIDSATHKALQHLNLPTIISDRLKDADSAGKGARKSRRRGAASKAANLRH
jgi:polyhydroxyalkanoate synthesis regulator phasin